MTITTLSAALVLLLLGLALGAVGGVLWVRSRPEQLRAVGQGMVEQAELLQGLDRLGDQLAHLERERAGWQGQVTSQLSTQVAEMRASHESLRRETRSLSTALRRPQVRGRWGELHLRRAVELAGLVERCDFDEQVALLDGAQRPDLVVRLAGGRCVVVDAKVPLEAYLDATEAREAGGAGDPDGAGEVSDAEREHHLRRHAAQVRAHVDMLGAKAYWRALPESPEFVVLFVPAESFLAAALTTDPGLIEHAAARHVVLATPTTLIALLRTVAHGWRQEAVTEQAREVHRLGRDLHQRLGTLSGHLDQVGRSLNATVRHFNAAVASYDSRVLVAARRFDDLTDATGLETPRVVALRAVERGAPGAEPSDPHADRQADRQPDRHPDRRAVDQGDADAPTVADVHPRDAEPPLPRSG